MCPESCWRVLEVLKFAPTLRYNCKGLRVSEDAKHKFPSSLHVTEIFLNSHRGRGEDNVNPERQQKQHLNSESKNTWAVSSDGELAGMIGDLRDTQYGNCSIQGKWRRE